MMDEKTYNKAVAINMRRIMYEKGISDKAVEMEQKAVSAFQNPFQD